MILNIPVFKYRLVVSKVGHTNAFDWLYATTCMYLNAQAKRAADDCSSVAKNDVRNHLQSILGDALITKIEGKLDKQFLEKSVAETYIVDNAVDDMPIFVYQDAFTGTVLPVVQHVFTDAPDAENSISNDFCLQDTNQDDIRQIQNALAFQNKYASPKVRDALKICIERTYTEPKYISIDVQVINNRLEIVSNIYTNPNWNDIWLNKLKNANDVNIRTAIADLEKNIIPTAADPLFTQNIRPYFLYNSKLNKIYQEFQLLNLPEYLMDAMRQADHSRASRRGLLTNLGYVVDQLASLIKLRDNIVMTENVIKSAISQSRIVTVYLDQKGIDYAVQKIYNLMVSPYQGKLHFKDSGQGLFAKVTVFGKNYDEVSQQMNYYRFYDDVKHLYDIRNNYTHDNYLQDYTVEQIIDLFCTVCQFLCNLYKSNL